MKKDTEKEKWWAMNREERLRRQKDFLTGFAFWVVWLVILWVVLKAAGSVLFPFLAAFAVAVLLSGAVQFIAERMHIQRGIVAVAVVLFFYIILAVFLYFAGSYLVRLIYDTARELSVFFSDTIVPVMQRFYQWLDRFVSVFYPTELTGKTSGLHGVGEESAQTLKNAGKLMSGISDGVIDGGLRDGGRNPGIFYETSDCGDRDRIYGTGISGDQSIFKAADPGGIPAGVPGWKKLCNRDNGKMHSFVLSDFWYDICRTYSRTVFTWHKKCICHRVYHCSA